MKHLTNRRRFLSAAAAGTFVSSAHNTEANPVPSRIIDTHTHFYDPTRPQGVPWPPKSDTLLYRRTLPPDLQRAVQGFRVVGTVVVEASPWLEDNQWLLDLASENRLIVGVVGHLDPGESTFKAHLQRFTKSRIFRGIRVNGLGIATGLLQSKFTADMQLLADADLEIDVIGDHTMLTDLVKLSDRVQHLRIVIDHLPFDPPADPDAAIEARNSMRELGRRPQIYAKVSGVLRNSGGRVPEAASFYRQSLDQLWDTFGGDRLVYGSNWPVSELLAPYATVLKVVREYFATRGTEAAEKYFWKNSAAVYKWLDRL